MAEPAHVFYWDASAALSVLFPDGHSADALDRMAREDNVHLLSTLAYVEVAAVICRLRRDGTLSESIAEEARRMFVSKPWRHTTALPDRNAVHQLARRWPLRGADLWHLACALNLRRELPELKLLTFDKRLREAAAGENLL